MVTLVVFAACVPAKHPVAKPVVKPVAQSVRPFQTAPSVALVDPLQQGPTYRVQLAADITRDVMPTDDLAIVISVDDQEVGRYPIVGKFEGRLTRIKQEIELPLGDYEIDYDYKGERYAGLPFRVAEVPVWGGRRALQLRRHQGTRVSLREKKLWIGRWWANDGPPQAWIIEWVREGQVVTTTSGREEHGIPAASQQLVAGAAATFRDTRVVPNTIWTYGEEYPLPDVVAQQPGQWAARVVHGGSAPVAVVFTVLPGGKLAEATPRKVQATGWEESWSKRLEARGLSTTEVEKMTAKLPRTNSTQPFDDIAQPGVEPPVRLSTSAVRALFRSKQLAEAWAQYISMNTPPIYQQAALPKPGGSSKEADKKTKLRTLRFQIEALIKVNGSPWAIDEFPRS